jgi:hypothetical protein
LVDHSPHLSTTSSSIVPHFSSTIAPHVSHHIPSPNISKTKSIVVPTSTNENTQDLVDQLKTCIATLSLLLQNKTEHEKYIIPNVKPYSDKQRSRRKKKQSSLTPDRLRFSKKSVSNEDITVRRCNSSNDQTQKSMLDRFTVFVLTKKIFL